MKQEPELEPEEEPEEEGDGVLQQLQQRQVPRRAAQLHRPRQTLFPR